MDSPPPGSSQNDWPYFRREVMGKLEHLEKQNDAQNTSIAKLDKDLAVLSTRVMLAASALALIVSALVEGAVKFFGH